mgnify:CR=1 FL=1
MSGEQRSARRLTLRQLLTSAEKCSRDLAEQVGTDLLRNLSEYRQLTRPHRKKSPYPSLVSVMNCLQHIEDTEEELRALAEYLLEHLELIRDHAQRERMNR